MAARLRQLMIAAASRRTSRQLAGTTFCDGCAQVCDPACRSAGHRERARLDAATHGFLR